MDQSKVKNNDDTVKEEEEEAGRDYSVFLRRAQEIDGLKKEAPKDQFPDGTQIEMIRRSNCAMYAVISAPKTQSFKSLSEGFWDAEKRLVRVELAKGHFAKTMGQFMDGYLHLLPYEAYYLVDRASLVVYNPHPIPLRTLFTLCFRNKSELDSYLVYAHLKRLGYVVRPFEELQDELPGSGETKISKSELFGSVKFVRRTPYKRARNIPVDFAVYKPNTPFKKSEPRKPDFMVKVCHFEHRDEFTSILDWNGPLILAVINGHAICFLSLKEESVIY